MFTHPVDAIFRPDTIFLYRLWLELETIKLKWIVYPITIEKRKPSTSENIHLIKMMALLSFNKTGVFVLTV